MLLFLLLLSKSRFCFWIQAYIMLCVARQRDVVTTSSSQIEKWCKTCWFSGLYCAKAKTRALRASKSNGCGERTSDEAHTRHNEVTSEMAFE